MKVTGLPRNDWLLCPEAVLPKEEAETIARVRALAGGARVLLVAPTFRDWPAPHLDILLDALVDMRQELEELNLYVVLRPHRFDQAKAQRIASKCDWLVLDPAACPYTQALLRASDLLLTDYSSIWVDYLLLDRPIVGFTPDLEEYGERRGFLYDYQAIFPGPLCATPDQLRTALVESARNPKFMSDRRKLALRLFHTYPDADSAHRVVKAIEREVKRTIR
jgi:CDP-glycerol glycerophosphotransferase